MLIDHFIMTLIYKKMITSDELSTRTKLITVNVCKQTPDRDKKGYEWSGMK